jgi:YbbR domain-containing protein
MKFLTQNWGWKILSLVAAFFVWLNISNEPELATIVSVPVEYRNYPKDLLISSDIGGTISVEARGPARQVRALTDSQVAAVIDFATVKGPGERTFTLNASELSLPHGIDLIRTIPGQLRFRFERRTSRALTVDIPYSGALAPGLLIVGRTVIPEQLNVSGPESHVTEARKLVADPFDLTRVTGDTDETLAVYASDPELRFMGTPQVTVKIRVRRARQN